MADSNEKIKQLQERLDKMVEYQNYFYREINLLREEIKKLNSSQPQQNNFAPNETPKPPVNRENSSFYQPQLPEQPPPVTLQTLREPQPNYQAQSQTESGSNYSRSTGFQETASSNQKRKSGAEEFIGKNLFSLIGIVITIIGVAIGAKYAIDRDLISPVMRIILGYLFAFATLGIALRLKTKYHNFSAVLLSGAMAMLYFLTYFAYDFYNLIPQKVSFLMMLLITVFTVAAAVSYNRQVIAHIGLVGAYAVPFLLSDNSGQAAVLFGYMTIVNFGILIVSVKKFWKPLYYSSFIFTWLIFSAWYFTNFNPVEHFTLAFTFLTTFFVTFYLTFVSYKLIADEEFNAEIVFLILVNSFIFYGFGYSILDSGEFSRQFLGLFTIFNALIHLSFAVVVKNFNLGGKINLYLPAALFLTFLTIAVPVQLRGNWVIILWAAEALILFAVGRIKQIAVFEIFSFPVMLLGLALLFSGWETAFLSDAVLIPFANNNFLTAAFFAAAFGIILFVNIRKKESENIHKDLQAIVNFTLPTVFLFVLYNTFRVEIGNYFQGEVIRTAVTNQELNNDNYTGFLRDNSLADFNAVWQINYTMLFLTILSFVNIKQVKSRVLGFINVGLNWILIFIFLTIGLYLISELRENYLAQTDAQFFNRGIFHLLIRYISYVFAVGLIAADYEYFKQKFLRDVLPDFPFNAIFDIGFYFTLLWILSSELLNLSDIFKISDSYKLGLSILWGTYALALIALGIYKRKFHLRIGAIVLFAVTLLKLFFYDIANLETIPKTIVFVSLGILLLIISFLYNKFKDVLFENNVSNT